MTSSGFYLTTVVLAFVALRGWRRRREGWGIPLLAVCGTTAAWYLGDVLYNDWRKLNEEFDPAVVWRAWLQVSLFLLSLGYLAPIVHRKINGTCLGRHSTVIELLDSEVAVARLQGTIQRTLGPSAFVWLALNVVALIRTGFDWKGLYFPWLAGHLAYPWARGRIGVGFDFLTSLCGYVNVFCLAGFGVNAAMARSRGTVLTALVLIILSWPLILFDRTRNTMLAIVLPGLLCLIFVRLRGRLGVQLGLLVGGFLLVNFWMAFVIGHRTSESIAGAFAAGKASQGNKIEHQGLNMFEELCWINTFFAKGTLAPNWGYRYFADAVNVVPRSLWPGKPTIGLDYAVARGQGTNETIGSYAATISTGMIGQGVTNFGAWGGPVAAAALMALWMALLARFDLTGDRLGRLPLYVFGLVLTFNLGRDISFLVAFPVVFGYAIIRISEVIRGPSTNRAVGSRLGA
jgi:hypothetical protein